MGEVSGLIPTRIETMDASLTLEFTTTRVEKSQQVIMAYRDGDMACLYVGMAPFLGTELSKREWNRLATPLTAAQAAHIGHLLLDLSREIEGQ